MDSIAVSATFAIEVTGTEQTYNGCKWYRPISMQILFIKIAKFMK